MQHITSPHNPRVALLRALHTGKGRKEQRQWLVEGPHLIREALRARLAPSLVVYDPAALAGTDLPDMIAAWADEGAEVATTTPEIIARVAEAQTPQGVVAAFSLEDVAPERLRGQRRGRMRPITLILDDLSDPGNAGTILRSALAADVDAVLLTPHSVDVFAPKVVRAASGAHSPLPRLRPPSRHATRSSFGLPTAAPDMVAADSGARDDCFDLDLTQPTGLIIGNEARGPSVAARKLATRFVRIPMWNGVESLNAAIAASVLLFESVRQRRAAPRSE